MEKDLFLELLEDGEKVSEEQIKNKIKMPLKKISDELSAAVNKASEGLKGDLYGSLSTAGAKIKDAVSQGKRNKFFDPSLSQYKEGMYLYFDPQAPVREVPVGRTGNTAIVATIVAGSKVGNDVVFNKPFNFFPTTGRKQILVTDENGEPVLNPDNSQKTVDGSGNKIWDACRGTEDEGDILALLSGKTLRVTKILRDFGPSDFVNNRPTGHKLTSVPLFEEA